MKGAAMKLGQVMSFLDVGLVPEEFREDFQAKLAELRDAAPKVSFKDMKRVIEASSTSRSTSSSTRSTPSRSPPRRSARSTRRACTTGATSR
jgi:predicted unusual protein kinase regulating ubiquinone biosynthesis (AarF/ABC1/UbiB family)